MIVINLEELEDFFSFLDRRVSNEIFYFFNKQIIDNKKQVILHFLVKIETNFILIQTVVKFPQGLKDKEIRGEIKKINFGDIKLIQGKISEMFISIS